MHDLPIHQFERVIPLLKTSPMRGHLPFPHGVVEGRHPGRIFVDQPDHPGSAVICNLSGFFFAFGEPAPELILPLVQQLRREPLNQENTVLFGDRPAWTETFRLAFHSPAEVPLSRLGFEHRPAPGRPPLDWRDCLPPGMRLEPITARLAETILDGTSTGNYGIDPWFIRIAGGPRAYEAYGLGYALLDGDQIASLCGVCGLGHGEAEMEVGTPPAYRGRGLATLVCAAFLEQAAAQGWKPTYTVDSRNLPSIAVARKLGYVEIEEIQGYRLY